MAAAKAFALKVETRRFEKFVHELLSGLTGDEALEVLTPVALEFTKRVVVKMPIDSGRATGGWLPFLEAHGADVTVRGEGVAQGHSEGSFAILRGRNPGIVIINEVPYIMRLEFGHSQQAPHGMVRITMREMRAGNIHGRIASEQTGRIVKAGREEDALIMANEFNNLVMSFEDHINTQMAATVGADNIHFDGVDFDTEDKTLWIVPRVISSIGGMARVGIQNDFVTLQVDIWTKTGDDQETTLKVRQIADTLRSKLHQTQFSIQASSEGTVVGRCVTDEAQVVRVPEPDPTLSHLAVTVPARAVNQTN